MDRFLFNFHLCYFIFAFKMQLELMLGTWSRDSEPINLPSAGDSQPSLRESSALLQGP